MSFYGDVQPGLSTLALEAQLKQFLALRDLPEKDVKTWPRKAPDGGTLEFDSADKKTVRDIMTFHSLQYSAYKMCYSVPKFIELGVSCTTTNRFSDWAESAWRLIDFEKFRRACP